MLETVQEARGLLPVWRTPRRELGDGPTLVHPCWIGPETFLTVTRMAEEPPNDLAAHPRHRARRHRAQKRYGGQDAGSESLFDDDSPAQHRHRRRFATQIAPVQG